MVRYYINYKISGGKPLEGSPCDKVMLERFETAIKNRNYEWTKRFLNSYVNKKMTSYDMPIVKWALATKRWNIAKELLIYNADTKKEGNISNPEKDNIIYIAALVNAHKNQAIGGYEFIKKFVKIDNLDIEEGDNNLTPFLLACKKGHIEVGLELLKYGAKINTLEKKTKNSCLHILTKKNNYKYIEYILKFFHKRSHENMDPKEYNVALDFIRGKNKEGISALEIANYEEFTNISKLLISSIKQEEEIIKIKKNNDLKRSKNKNGYPFNIKDRMANNIMKIIEEEHKLRKEAENEKIEAQKKFNESVKLPPET
jgi:ankyrin repeat protein